MKIFQIRGDKLPAPVTFKYNSNGHLFSFECDETMTDKQLDWVYEHFPVHISGIEVMRKKKVNVVEVPLTIDFETFFAAYSAKYGKRVERKTSEKIWDKMTQQNQLAAYMYIREYFGYVKRQGHSPKMVKTYLNNEPWND